MLRKRILMCTLATSAFLSTATAVAAAETVPEPSVDSRLVLTLAQGETAYPVNETAWLVCGPAGGNHPAPASACDVLAGTGGDVAAVDVEPDQACTLIYAPVTVTARGHWKEQPVDYRQTFPNACVLDSTKGALFQI